MIDAALCEGLALLLKHEGFRGKPYQDTKGNVTIGYGRNLEANPLTEDEARFLLDNIVMRLEVEFGFFSWYAKLSPVRKWVCLNMAYHLGMKGFAGFKKMIAAIEKAVEKDRGLASWAPVKAEMLDSRWAREFPSRAHELANLMVQGRWS